MPQLTLFTGQDGGNGKPTAGLLEHWKPVVGYEGRYQVSNCGRVWSDVSKKPLASAPKKRLYLGVQLYSGDGSKGASQYIHNIVAAAFLGPRPAGQQVDHARGHQHNYVSSLEYVTPSLNSQRAYDRGARKPTLKRQSA